MRKEKNTVRLDKGLRLFRAGYTNGGGGGQKIAAVWWIEFRDHKGKPRRVPACADQDTSAELARKLRKLVGWKVSGVLPDPELSRWLETMPDKLRERLAKIGLLDARHVAASKPLAEHLDDWKAALLAKDITSRHADLVVQRARRIIEGCDFGYLTDISASEIQTYLAELRQDKPKARGLSAQTFNFYLKAIKQFCRWMVRDGRASESPIDHLDGLNVKLDRRHDRRALTVDEMGQLISTATNGPTRFGMTGPERAMLYRVAVETGLRAGELRSLTRASFALDGPEPTVTIQAAYAKNRRTDELPLRTATVGLLRDFLAGKFPSASAFSVPVRTEVVRMLRADLTDARSAWIEKADSADETAKRKQSNFLTACDDTGHYADFHALRHTFISNLAAAGVHPKTAQALARHSTIGLTMDRYTHAYRPCFDAIR